MKTQDIKNIASAYKQVLEKKTLDPVNPDELKGTHAQRKDKDIDNDGDTDKSDEYLHNRRKAVKNAMKKEAKDYGPGHIGAVQKMLDKEREAKKAKDAMKKEEVELDEISRDTARSYIRKASAHKTTGETPKKDRSSGVDLAGKKAYGIGGKAKVMATEEVEIDEAMTKAQTRALQSVKAQPKDKVSLKPAPWDKKKDEKMNESRWPILNRIMERQNHDNMDNGSPRGEGLSPSAKAELARSEGDSGIDGAKAAADTARNAVAQVKVAPKRPGDKTDGDKTMPKNDGK